MAIDQVHDLQAVYRELLHSMSRPGSISFIQETVERAGHNLPCYDATFICAMTLLDAEVTFHILSKNNQDLIEKISEYTLASYAPASEADFIIILREDTEAEIIDCMEQCKIGNLIDPQKSSTWIIESTPLSNERGRLLSGPGIKTTSTLKASFTEALWQTRNECTKEYPLGIDMIFTDEKAQLVCVPRTTKIEMTEVD
ncbi:phosphonate C-P lyase system protein PhnH [Oceanobacillus rekensis]|uniref:phosphonate C-P lyase system protein PhnH n=1 Tax=Oceanobacillus rekensis TaxID=937927 RepID=UPI000B43D61D|nr:phosphonate C-P lyase system protein PhnH [Oceanobacillus rekensis]